MEKKSVQSLKLLLLSDIHCVGQRRFAFSRINGEAKSAEQIQSDLTAILDHFLDDADYVLMAGDFTDNSRPDQYEAVLQIMNRYAPGWFCVIPGNHDTANFNTAESWETRMKRFKTYLGAYLPGGPERVASRECFPYVRDLGRGFALIGLDSTLERTALGRLGPRQLKYLENFLNGPEFSEHHKIILIHHDVTGDTKMFNGFEIFYGNILTDLDDFLDILKSYTRKSGARRLTIVNGHTHLKNIDNKTIPGVTAFTIPSFGSHFEEDFIAVELFNDGSFREIKTYNPKVRSRPLKKLGKIFFPKIHL